MRLSPYLLGVDGGGTQTIAAIASPRGEVVGVGRSGSGNYHNVGRNLAARAIRLATNQALRRSGIKPRDLGWACIGLAALNLASDFDEMAPAIIKLRLAPSMLLTHDSMIALAGANGALHGAVIIAGTGTVAAAIGRNGKLVRVGGWGSIIDDEGSAYHLGRTAIRAMFRALDGREQKTSLTRGICSHFDVRDPESIHRLIYYDKLSVEQIASLSSVVARAAEQGDQVAKGLLSQAAVSLGSQLRTLYRKTDFAGTSLSVRTVGGLFDAGPGIIQPLRKFLRDNVPSVKLSPAILPPVAGALIIAGQFAGPEVQPFFVTRLKEQRRKLWA